MVSHEEVKRALCHLEEEIDEYSLILMMDEKTSFPKMPPCPVVGAQLPPCPDFKACWGNPGDIGRINRGGMHDKQGTCLSFGLESKYELEVLEKYLAANGEYNLRPVPMDGNCMFHCIRRSTLCPANYSSELLKRQIVLWMILNHALVYPVIKPMLLGLYGHESSDHKGPYSFIGYLEGLLWPNVEGDVILLWCISVMWQMRITLINSGMQPYQVTIRH